MIVIVLKNRSNKIRSNEIRIRRELPVIEIIANSQNLSHFEAKIICTVDLKLKMYC